MARTKTEVRQWLDAQVGSKPIDDSNRDLDGQCVALIKRLLAFLGAPNPYAARGNARSVGDSYLRDGIARNGEGWLNVVVNRDMAAPWGHVWIDVQNENNYESNGYRALYVTKNTRPYSQRQQVVNLDQYILPEPAQNNNQGGKLMTPNFIRRMYYVAQNRQPSQEEIDFHMAKSNPESFINGFGDDLLWKQFERERNAAYNERDNADTRAATATRELAEARAEIERLKKQAPAQGSKELTDEQKLAVDFVTALRKVLK